jgi:hypothetical protein
MGLDPGFDFCSTLLVVFSYILVLFSFPISIFFCIKIVKGKIFLNQLKIKLI